MELKDVLGEIESDGANLVHGRLLEWALTPPLWHAEAVGGRPHHQASSTASCRKAHRCPRPSGARAWRHSMSSPSNGWLQAEACLGACRQPSTLRPPGSQPRSEHVSFSTPRVRPSGRRSRRAASTWLNRAWANSKAQWGGPFRNQGTKKLLLATSCGPEPSNSSPRPWDTMAPCSQPE